jgi:hypothetical protein
VKQSTRQSPIASLTNDPSVALYKIDLVNRRALLVRFSEQDYRRATVLDDRALSAATQALWVPLEAAIAASAKIPQARPPHFMFHVGHCGSTLLSRLLGELPGCFSLREPVPLFLLAYARRTLNLPISRVSPEHWRQLFCIVLKLLGRTYRAEERSVIKPTSVCANLLEPALQTHAQSRAILLYVDLETYLAAMLRTESLRESVRGYAPAWLGDLNGVLSAGSLRLYDLADAGQAVLAWLGAMHAFIGAIESNPQRVLLLNFDAFLAAPAEQLERAATFLQLANDAPQLRALVESRLMRTYAKDTPRTYDAQTRHAELAVARRRFAAEIRAGVEWSGRLVKDNEALTGVARYLSRDGS